MTSSTSGQLSITDHSVPQSAAGHVTSQPVTVQQIGPSFSQPVVSTSHKPHATTHGASAPNVTSQAANDAVTSSTAAVDIKPSQSVTTQSVIDATQSQMNENVTSSTISASPASSQALSLHELQNPQTFQLGESCAAPAAKRKTTRADFEAAAVAASRRRGEVKVSYDASTDPFSSLDPLWSSKK